MSVRQVWKHKTSTPKSSPSSQKESPPLPPRVYLQSPSPPSYNPLRDQMINQLHNISTILDSHTNPSNAYIHAPPSPPPQQIHPPSHAQVEFHSSFCHIAEDILVEIDGYVYPVDFVILDIKEDEKKPFILGMPFLTTAKAEIRFDKGTITLKSGKNKINFFKIPESPRRVEEETENDIGLVAPTNTVSRLIWNGRKESNSTERKK
ncbi:zf-CCHC domain-containing protein [Tanacetum coccineum]